MFWRSKSSSVFTFLKGLLNDSPIDRFIADTEVGLCMKVTRKEMESRHMAKAGGVGVDAERRKEEAGARERERETEMREPDAHRPLCEDISVNKKQVGGSCKGDTI